jgi:hypothetical protein
LRERMEGREGKGEKEREKMVGIDCGGERKE